METGAQEFTAMNFNGNLISAYMDTKNKIIRSWVVHFLSSTSCVSLVDCFSSTSLYNLYLLGCWICTTSMDFQKLQPAPDTHRETVPTERYCSVLSFEWWRLRLGSHPQKLNLEPHLTGWANCDWSTEMLALSTNFQYRKWWPQIQSKSSRSSYHQRTNYC